MLQVVRLLQVLLLLQVPRVLWVLLLRVLRTPLLCVSRSKHRGRLLRKAPPLVLGLPLLDLVGQLRSCFVDFDWIAGTRRAQWLLTDHANKPVRNSRAVLQRTRG